MHETEICEYPIRLFCFYNNLICVQLTMPHKGASTQQHNQQVLAKPHHSPSVRDQQARQKLQQKAKIRSRACIQLGEDTLKTRSTSYFTPTGCNRWIIKFKRNFNPHPVCNSRRFELFRNDRLLLH